MVAEIAGVAAVGAAAVSLVTGAAVAVAVSVSVSASASASALVAVAVPASVAAVSALSAVESATVLRLAVTSLTEDVGVEDEAAASAERGG